MDEKRETSSFDTSKTSNASRESECGSQGGIMINNRLKTWTEISRINYKSSMFLDAVKGQNGLKDRSTTSPPLSSLIKIPAEEIVCKNEEHDIVERFPVHVTSLMNEDQLWGCFYIFPDLYSDEYSPVEQIRKLADVPELIGGVLTRDMVTACLTYLRRTPILGDYVYIKLDLSSKLLNNIQVLEYYKYLVYLDLSYNLLTSLDVLSHLLYLQYLSVDYNRLTTVLEYDTPQWFLTEVHYKFNSVKTIRNLKALWSITVLDLSHNNITSISGLEDLHFLRRLDLSFNHIQRLENLNHLPLTWLDISYNNISSFELSEDKGLWTLLHLEYLNLSENNLTSLKIFSGCTRLQELNARNNRLSILLELAIYARQLRRLSILDLRANPLCSLPGYQDVILNTFPILLVLDAMELDPVDCRNARMSWKPDVTTFATQRLQRLLYVEQLSRAQVSCYIPPADTTEVPIVVLVGAECVGKGTLSRRLAAECIQHVDLGRQHTTAKRRNPRSYIEVSREKFDDMIVNGQFLTYSEIGGESYGLSREEAFVTEGKVKVVAMDLIGALMLRLRGRRPYLVLLTCSNKKELFIKQCEQAGTHSVETLRSHDLRDRSTLQLLLSGRIIITGIINEILVDIPDEKEKTEFLIPSGCSLLFDNSKHETHHDYGTDDRNMLKNLSSSSDFLEEVNNKSKEESLYSLYKESNATGIDLSEVDPQTSYQDENMLKKFKLATQHQTIISKIEKSSKSVDFTRYTSSTWKDVNAAPMVPPSMKSSKSVTFISHQTEAIESGSKFEPSGMMIEPQPRTKEGQPPTSISGKLPRPSKLIEKTSGWMSADDPDLWLCFLVEAGLLEASDVMLRTSTALCHKLTKSDITNSIIQIDKIYNFQETNECIGTSIRDDYDEIHRKSPGLFWNVVKMDDPEEAFAKIKAILRDLVQTQRTLRPMFDIDFANLPHYPSVEKRLLSIRQQIATQQLFH